MFRQPPVFAGTLHEYRSVDIEDGKVTVIPSGRVVFADRFRSPDAWEGKPNSYQNAIDIAYNKDFLGEKCLVLTCQDKKKKDTAWSMVSKRIQLGQSARQFLLTLDVCSKNPLNEAVNTFSKSWRNAVIWYDSKGKMCGDQEFRYLIRSGHFGEVVIRGDIPAEATSFAIQLGFDSPNISHDNVFAIRQIEFSLIDSEKPFTKEGRFESKVYRGGNMSWKAKTPPGTSVKFQISTATDNNGEPGQWTEFHGPNGAPDSYYTKPIQIDAAFVRYRAVLTPSGKDRPLLESVTVGDQTESAWSRHSDIFPPRVKIISETPTTNRRIDLVLSITDDEPVRWSTLKIKIDGQSTTQFVRHNDRIVFKATRDWSDGLHRVDVDVADFRNNVVVAKKCFFIGQSPTTPKVTLRDDGMTLIDGKPFFPIGLYGVCKREFNNFDIDKAFKDLKGAGFNFAHSYSMPRTDEFLAAAHKYGFKLWTVARFPDQRFIEIERHHPAIIAWYLGDDTSANTSPTELFDRDDAVKAVDPTRITTQADPVGPLKLISNYFHYVKGTDSFMPEIYPVSTKQPQHGARCVAKTVLDVKRCHQDIVDAGAGVRSVWPIIQYFKGWGWERFPTMQELRGMSYAALIHGGHGITWYTYGGTVVPEKKIFNYGVTTTPEIWNNMSTVATQIRSLVPVLTERTPKEQPDVQILSGPARDYYDNPSVTCMLKKHAGFVYLFSVNASEKPVRAAFVLPHIKGGEVLFENRNVTLENERLTDTFEGHAVHVYKLK